MELRGGLESGAGKEKGMELLREYTHKSTSSFEIATAITDLAPEINDLGH